MIDLISDIISVFQILLTQSRQKQAEKSSSSCFIVLGRHTIIFQLNSSKEEVKSVLEKKVKQEEENVKKIEDEKKLTEANSKSHQTELQTKQDVSFE